MYLDKLLLKNKNVKTVKDIKYLLEVFHLYQINVKRDQLQNILLRKYRCKNSLPTPIHLQPASRFLKHKKGDFPKAEMLAKTTLSLPVHEFITNKDIKKMATLINKFYS